MVDLTVTPAEEGAAKVTVTFTDENGDEVSPTAVTWSLSDETGAIINNRNHEILVPAASISWLIYGDDLAVADPEALRRRITIDATYNSTLGNDIPLRGQFRFPIEKFVVPRSSG